MIPPTQPGEGILFCIPPTPSGGRKDGVTDQTQSSAKNDGNIYIPPTPESGSQKDGAALLHPKRENCCKTPAEWQNPSRTIRNDRNEVVASEPKHGKRTVVLRNAE